MCACVYQCVDAGIAFALEPGGRAMREEAGERGARAQRGGSVDCRETGKGEQGVEVVGNRFDDFRVRLARDGVARSAIQAVERRLALVDEPRGPLQRLAVMGREQSDASRLTFVSVLP